MVAISNHVHRSPFYCNAFMLPYSWCFVCKFPLSKVWEVLCCVLMWRESGILSASPFSPLQSAALSSARVMGWDCWKRPLPLVTMCYVPNNVLISGQEESSEAGQTRFLHPHSTLGQRNSLVGCMLHRPDTEAWGESGLSSRCFLTCKCIMAMGHFEA